MFNIKINETPVIFSKFFSASDREAVLTAVPEGTKRVVFVDTAATDELVSTVAALLGQGVEVIVRDHHDEPAPRNARGEQIKAAVAQVRELCGDNTRISNREEHPACSSMIQVGEFANWICSKCGELADIPNSDWCEWRDGHGFETEFKRTHGTVIVADPDFDGLTGAMKALGVVYEGLDADAEVFDTRPRQSAETLTTLGWLAVRSLGTLPAYNPKRPDVSASAKSELFERFVDASQGDEAALEWFTARVLAYEAQVSEAKRLAETCTEPAPRVVWVDTVGAERFDLTTLSRLMEARPGCRTTVIRKSGFLSRDGGEMISLAVPRRFQKEVDLRDLVPEGTATGKEVGIISNVSFLLHVSEAVWEETILPALQG